MSFDNVVLDAPQEEKDLTLPSPFKRILSKTSELEVDEGEFSQSLFYDQLKRIKVLEYEISNLKNQQLLDKLDHDKSISEYLKDLKLKDEEILLLSSNEKFLFEQNQELTTEMAKLKLKNAESLDLKDDEISKLRRSYALKQDAVTELTYDKESQISKFEILQKESELKIKQFESHIFELQSNLDDQISTNNANSLKIRDLQNQLETLKLPVNYGETDGSTELLYKKQFNTQIGYIEELKNKITSYERNLNRLSKSNELVEVLKEERKQFVSKLEKTRQVETQFEDLKLEYEKLQARYAKWENLAKGCSTLEFMNNVKLTQEENDSLKEKTMQLSVQVSELKESERQLSNKIEELNSEIAILKKNSHDAQLINLKNNSAKNLLEQEVGFLKSQVEFFHSENKLLLSGKVSEETEQKQRQIDELNKLVSNYKNELTTSIEELKKSSGPTIGTKRQRVDDSISVDQVKEMTILKLEIENKDRSISILRENINSMNKEIESLKTNISQFQSTRQDLNLLQLQKENEQLISQLQNKPIKTVPKTVYDRLISEQTSLQDKLSESIKKQTRLREAFDKQITRFNTILYKLLGYKIEFNSANELKVISSRFHNDEFLTFNVIEHSRKIHVEISDCHVSDNLQNLIQFWIHDRNDIPCFLSALNLELFEKK